MKKIFNFLLLTVMLCAGAMAAAAQSLDDPIVFDANYYMGKYPDLCNAFRGDTQRAREHWLNNGIREGRQASPVFSAVYYVTLYPNIKNAFGTNYRMPFAIF
jgi:hypothetical protein